MKYYFTKESSSDGIKLLKLSFSNDGKDYIKHNLIEVKVPIIIEGADSKKYRVSLINDKIHVERIR